MSSLDSKDKCKLAYAADGTLICDPKKYKSKPIYNYEGKPADFNDKCDKCIVFDKSCIKKL